MSDLEKGKAGGGGEEKKVEKAVLWGLTWMQAVCLGVLVAQNSSNLLMMNTSRGPGRVQYASTTVVVVTEVVKVGLAFLLLLREHAWDTSAAASVLSKTLGDGRDWLRVSVPALVYLVQNNLLFVATSHLDAATTQITYQLKLLTTAVFAVVFLRKSLSLGAWISLAVLTAGVALVQLSLARSPGGGSKPETHPDHAAVGSKVVGLSAILVACFLSGFAAIYFEMILKGSSTSVWIRNIQLGTIGALFGLGGVYYNDGTLVANKGFFYGYDPLVWAIVANSALGGLVVALVVKYADNILKGFATGVSVVLCALYSVLFLSVVPDVEFVCGAAAVLTSVMAYNANK